MPSKAAALLFFYVYLKGVKTMNQKRKLESALIRQAATMCSYALEIPELVDMTRTKADLKGYQTSLVLVKDAELKPFAKQARVFVTATLKYLSNRTEQNLGDARQHRDKLADMMTLHLDGDKRGV